MRCIFLQLLKYCSYYFYTGNYNDDTFDRMEAAISGLLPSVRDNVESRPALEERRYNRNFETRRSRRGDAIDPRWFPGYRGSAARNADSGNSGVLSENIRSADDDGTRSFRRELQFNRDPYDQVDRQYSNGISGGRSSNGVSGRRSGRNMYGLTNLNFFVISNDLTIFQSI